MRSVTPGGHFFDDNLIIAGSSHRKCVVLPTLLDNERKFADHNSPLCSIESRTQFLRLPLVSDPAFGMPFPPS